jgi:hypothetical protein
MPIRSLLAETSFDPEQTEMIAKAFDDAWAKVQIDEAEPAMASLVRTALAKRIIEMAHRPGVDVQKLRDDAIAYVKNNPLWPSLWRARHDSAQAVQRGDRHEGQQAPMVVEQQPRPLPSQSSGQHASQRVLRPRQVHHHQERLACD